MYTKYHEGNKNKEWNLQFQMTEAGIILKLKLWNAALESSEDNQTKCVK